MIASCGQIVVMRPPDARFVAFASSHDVATIARLPFARSRPETGIISFGATKRAHTFASRAKALYEHGLASIARECSRQCPLATCPQPQTVCERTCNASAAAAAGVSSTTVASVRRLCGDLGFNDVKVYRLLAMLSHPGAISPHHTPPSLARPAPAARTIVGEKLIVGGIDVMAKIQELQELIKQLQRVRGAPSEASSGADVAGAHAGRRSVLGPVALATSDDEPRAGATELATGAGSEPVLPTAASANEPDGEASAVSGTANNTSPDASASWSASVQARWGIPGLRLGWYAAGCAERTGGHTPPLWVAHARQYKPMAVGSSQALLCPSQTAPGFSAADTSPFNVFEFFSHRKGRSGPVSIQMATQLANLGLAQAKKKAAKKKAAKN